MQLAMVELMAGSLGFMKAVAPRRFQLRLRRLALHFEARAVRVRGENPA
ncbi:MAG: hypothetical protein ACREPI_00470 [Candidatus Dormibacterales bacterium]